MTPYHIVFLYNKKILFQKALNSLPQDIDICIEN